VPLIKLTCKSSGNCVFARWEARGRRSLSLGPVIRSEQNLQKKENGGGELPSLCSERVCVLGGCCWGIVVFAELSPLLSSSLAPSGREIRGKEANIDPGALECRYCLRLLLLVVLIRGEGWGMSSPSAMRMMMLAEGSAGDVSRGGRWLQGGIWIWVISKKGIFF